MIPNEGLVELIRGSNFLELELLTTYWQKWSVEIFYTQEESRLYIRVSRQTLVHGKFTKWGMHSGMQCTILS